MSRFKKIPFVKKIINKLELYLRKHTKQKQWLWFVFLWLSGFSSLYLVAYLIKAVMKGI